MKIAHISTCVAPTPPPRSSSIVWVASYLTEQLVELGHDVTLFATGDSKTKARLWSYFDSPADFTDPGNEILHVLALGRAENGKEQGSGWLATVAGRGDDA